MKNRLLAHCSSLDLLKRIPEKSISLAYIDPPWKSEGIGSEEDLISLYLHTAAFCKACLKDDGVIVWHAVPRQISGVRALLDRVYGEDNFETEFILNPKQISNDRSRRGPNHSNLIAYSKTSGVFCFNPPTGEMTNAQKNTFNKSDEDGRAYRVDALTIRAERPALRFEWRGHIPPPGSSWRYSLARLDELAEKGGIDFSGNGLPRSKRYLDNMPPPPLGSVWEVSPPRSAERVASSRRVAQQPIELAKRILGAFTNEGDTIVDPYCGSGSVIVAAEMMNRQWHASDSDAEFIEITSERVRRESVSDFISSEADEVGRIDVQHRLSDLLKTFKVDYDPHADDTHILVHRDESKTLEFKQTLSLDLRTGQKGKHIETSVLKTIAAFLNTDGGTLLIGVADDHGIPGIGPEIAALFKGSRDSFLLHFKNLLKDKIGPEFYPLIDQHIVLLDDLHVLRVNVGAAKKPCFIGDDFYVRTNPATDKIAGGKMLEYVQRHFESS